MLESSNFFVKIGQFQFFHMLWKPNQISNIYHVIGF
jgi:hypothetical protein